MITMQLPELEPPRTFNPHQRYSVGERIIGSAAGIDMYVLNNSNSPRHLVLVSLESPNTCLGGTHIYREIWNGKCISARSFQNGEEEYAQYKKFVEDHQPQGETK